MCSLQELAKDKWLCPLSGKKFKGPEFVRKHILNKHGERLEEVKANTAYFNNYLRDPKRPQLPEMRPGMSQICFLLRFHRIWHTVLQSYFFTSKIDSRFSNNPVDTD